MTRGGAPVRFDTRKATALLAYLAVTGDAHGRDTIAALLWPDFDRGRSGAALRRTLSVLNSATGGDCLALEGHTVALRAERVHVDVDEFRRLADASGHGHPADRTCVACLPDLRRATALYRADFLAGFALRDSPEFDDWQSFQAERLRAALASVLDRLVLAHVEAGTPDQAVEPARRRLSLDPLHEPAYAALMRLYALTGQRSAALQQYRACVQILDTELGVPPLSATTALNDLIRTDQLGAASPAPTPPVVVAAAPAHELPLVGRSVELALIEELLAARRTSRALAITGESGVGKTRLLAEMTDRVRRAGSPVVVVRCHDGEQGLAFGVLADLLRAARLVSTGADDLLPAWSRELRRILPELAAGSADDSPPLDSPGAQARFFAAVVEALRAWLPPGSVVAVEDAHWADDSSLTALAYVVRRSTEVPFVFAVTWRLDELRTNSPLRQAIGVARRSGAATTLELGRLDQEAVRALAAAAFPGTSIAAAMVERLSAETGGLPLFVTEYLEAFRRDGQLPDDGEWRLPGGVRDLLESRIAAVTEATAQVLAAAAVLHGSVDPVTLRATSGRSDDEVVTALEEASGRSILLEAGPAPAGRYEFTSEAMRRLVSAGTSLARKRLLHGRAADVLMQRRDADAMSAAVAAHLRGAGREPEAAEWSWRAARRAQSLYAHVEALDHLATAVALGQPGHQVHQATGDVLTALGRYAEALISYERAAASCAVDDARAPALAEIEQHIAHVQHRLGEWELAASHLRAALDVLSGSGDDILRARILADLALVAHRRGDDAEAGDTSAQALELAARTGDPAALAQVYDVLGVLAGRAGRYDDAVQLLRTSLVHAARLSDPSLRVAALNNLALVLSDAGRPED
ncbi:MAG: hypothetical protein QOG49_752, partial [Frankiaceae bacterium]|nr:hypothetical protein [Frankiaceae bacterium]